jgi:quinol monooxygenase YgiN
MSEVLQLTAEFPAVHKSDLEAFKRLVATAVAGAAEEPGTLGYDWFSNQDESAFFVRERYASSEALLAHAQASAETVGRLAGLGGGLKVEIFGEPSPAVLEAMAAVAPTVYPPVAGK